MRQAVLLGLGFAVAAQVVCAEGLSSSRLPKARPAPPAVALLALLAAVVPAELTASTANAAIPALRPRPRPVTGPEVVEPPTVAAVSVPRPRPRPEGPAERFAAVEPQPDKGSVAEPAAVPSSEPRPKVRPEGLQDAVVKPGTRRNFSLVQAAAIRIPQDKKALQPKAGSVCGDPSIRGADLAPMVSKVKGCGIEAPVKVTEIAGVKLSQPAIITCETAQATKQWIERGMSPQFGANPVVKLQIAGSYTCRPRNGIKGAKVSEHGRGQALDISGFTLADGSMLSVKQDYRQSKAIKASHKAACGIFGTTLGPGSDGHHEDHLHFDIVHYRNGTYCR
ncbi:MAG: extensin family protein [Gemmobacter sp.]|jgi:hypothetical protein|nr:extensin family protein [Gemmobacter sp.]